MVKRFNVLENKILIRPEKATKITQAICALHNLIVTREANFLCTNLNKTVLKIKKIWCIVIIGRFTLIFTLMELNVIC